MLTDEILNTSECPHCREINSYYQFPLWLSIIGSILIILTISYVYIHYFIAKKQSSVCEALLHQHHR